MWLDKNAMVFGTAGVEIGMMIQSSRRLVLLVSQSLDNKSIIGQLAASLSRGPIRWVPPVVAIPYVPLNVFLNISGDGSASSDDTETQEPDLPCRSSSLIRFWNGANSKSVAVYDLFMIYPIINPTKPNNTTSMNDRPPPLLLVSRFNSS
ncbi:hypothetical protein V6N12_017613 [Hibiscus sabdariffa]|uniref:Uncharacterized protein n=1 Tax=Hibiscus sabdariffa TaxID=183260 RepID=A0ABR2CG05_9ROSI